jgi:regulator of sigma E protease
VLGNLFNPLNLIIFILMLGILIFVHEFGHFITAKRLGIPVLEFGFGFPPRAWRFGKSDGWIELQGRRIVIPRTCQLPKDLQIGSRVTYKTKSENGREILTGLDVVDAEGQGLLSSPVLNLDRGTEYTINWIPVGGFVRLAGEDDPAVPGGFLSAKPWIRAPILLAGVTMNLLLAYLVFSISAAVTPPYAQIQTTRITQVQPISPAASAGLLKGDAVVAINGQNVKDDFPAMKQVLKENAGKAVTLSILRNGKLLDPISIVPRVNPPPGEGALGIALDGMLGLQITSVAPGSVADRAGVRAGDVLAFIVDPQKSTTLKDQNQLAEYTRAHPGFKIEWHVARDGKLIEPDPIVVAVPDSIDDNNATLGLNMQTSLIDAPLAGAQTMVRIIGSVPQMVDQIIHAGLPDNSVVGIVGIYQATGEVAQRGGFIALMEFLGVLSLNLAIVNLFPFPPLDGGQLVFVALEWVRGGKRIELRKQRLISEIGIVLLLGLMFLITFSDIGRVIAGRSILP